MSLYFLPIIYQKKIERTGHGSSTSRRPSRISERLQSLQKRFRTRLIKYLPSIAACLPIFYRFNCFSIVDSNSGFSRAIVGQEGRVKKGGRGASVSGLAIRYRENESWFNDPRWCTVFIGNIICHSFLSSTE